MPARRLVPLNDAAGRRRAEGQAGCRYQISSADGWPGTFRVDPAPGRDRPHWAGRPPGSGSARDRTTRGRTPGGAAGSGPDVDPLVGRDRRIVAGRPSTRAKGRASWPGPRRTEVHWKGDGSRRSVRLSDDEPGRIGIGRADGDRDHATVDELGRLAGDEENGQPERSRRPRAEGPAVDGGRVGTVRRCRADTEQRHHRKGCGRTDGCSPPDDWFARRRNQTDTVGAACQLGGVSVGIDPVGRLRVLGSGAVVDDRRQYQFPTLGALPAATPVESDPTTTSTVVMGSLHIGTPRQLFAVLALLLANSLGDVPHDGDRPADHSEVMTNTKRIASLLIVLSTLAVPSAAFAADDLDDSSPAGEGGCFYTDADGYDIPIFNGEGVIVDGKLVTCKDGELTIKRSRASRWSKPATGGDVLAPTPTPTPTPTHRTSRVSRSTSPLLASR